MSNYLEKISNGGWPLTAAPSHIICCRQPSLAEISRNKRNKFLWKTLQWEVVPKQNTVEYRLGKSRETEITSIRKSCLYPNSRLVQMWRAQPRPMGESAGFSRVRSSKGLDSLRRIMTTIISWDGALNKLIFPEGFITFLVSAITDLNHALGICSHIRPWKSCLVQP